jgi:molybdenum cofactor cytidylyltransferase
MTTPGFLILAAGAATRFGSDKMMARLPCGRPVLDSTLSELPKGHPVHVVCKPGHTALMDLLKKKDVPFSINPNASEGMATSLVSGLQNTRQWQGWVICLADMPWIRQGTYRSIMRALTPSNIVVPVINQGGKHQLGNPVAFGKDFRETLLALEGDHGARTVVHNNASAVVELDVKDHGILLDIDYPDDINNVH